MSYKVGRILNDVFSEDALWKIRLLKNWSKLIGPMVGKVKIDRIENDLLVLGVLHPVFAQEVTFIAEDLKKEINSFLKAEKIKTIRFRLCGPKISKKGRDIFVKKQRELNVSRQCQVFNSLSRNEREKLNDLPDLELQQALEKFCVRCKKVY